MVIVPPTPTASPAVRARALELQGSVHSLMFGYLGHRGDFLDDEVVPELHGRLFMVRGMVSAHLVELTGYRAGRFAPLDKGITVGYCDCEAGQHQRVCSHTLALLIATEHLHEPAVVA